jgi:hypothetical protein
MPIFSKKPADIELPSYQQGKVIPVLSAGLLLRSPGHQALIDEIRLRIDLPDDQFNLLYLGFINCFAEFVQLLPVKSNARLGTLLNEGLLRGLNALHYLVENYKEADSLSCYALFTGAVLYDVAKTLTKQRVFITQKGGTHIADWVFSRGSLQEQGAEWYKIFPYRANFSRLRDPLSILLAQQILPREGYEWISSHWSVFVDWLELLCQIGGLVGKRFNKILDIIRSHEEVLYLTHLPEVEVELRHPEDTAVADEFFQWLDRELAEEKLKITDLDPDLYVLKDGVFLDARVIDRFSKYYNSPTTVVWFQIGNCLGIAKQSGQDFRFDQFFGSRGEGFLKSSGQHSVKGLYLSKDFMVTKGAVNLNIQLHGEAPARDYNVMQQQLIKPTLNKTD